MKHLNLNSYLDFFSIHIYRSSKHPPTYLDPFMHARYKNVNTVDP